MSERGRVGILVHGRHLGTKDWELLVWGESDRGKLGSIPKACEVFVQLGRELEPVVVFGTGASERDGIKESVFTKQFLRDHVARLFEFSRLKELSATAGFVAADFVRLADSIICETESLNTLQEVENASEIFLTHGVETIYHVTCSTHAPRCLLSVLQVRAAGKLHGQTWYTVADDMTFSGLPIERSVVVLEEPHRPDDPTLYLPRFLHLNVLLRRLLKLGLWAHSLARRYP